MTVLQTIAVAFAMFSAVPVPQFDWNEKNMRYSLCAFPLVGVLCGVLWCVCASLPLPAMVRAAGFCLIPVWVTGGIHLDGYADTCDALCSYGDTQKKLDILKDPHCGAFAVIRLCSYFVAYFALCCCVQFTPQVGAVWLLALVLERACSGYAVAAFPLAKNTGLAHTFATAADRTTVLWCVCASLPLPAMVRAAGFCLIPVWVTGGIHLDGYADTCDALCSYGDTQKKLDILKDPHCGAFAVIRLCSYFVAYFALCCCVQFTPQVGAVWLLALVLERACSGYAVAAFPLAKNTGLAHTFATAADRTTVRRVLGCLSIVLTVALFALGGGVLVLAAGVALWRYHRVAVKQFGGITGDLAGWFLQKAELYMLAALVFCQWKGFL